MNSSQKISIVLPSYNGEKYLRDSIESVLAQSYSDWELILVDDCSTDATLSVMEEYASIDTRLQVIHNEENQKLPASLNIGFDRAQGQYFTWTSDDNMYLPEALEVMKDELDHAGANVAMVSALYEILEVDEAGEVVSKRLPPPFDSERIYESDKVGACFLYRRGVKEQIGGYDENLFCAEDYDYWLRIYKNVGKIKAIDKVLYKYRLHPTSLTATRKKQVKQQTSRIYTKFAEDWMEEYKDQPDKLTNIYYESYMDNSVEAEMVRKKVRDSIPILKNEQVNFNKEKYVLFGAGEYGCKVADALKGKVECFIDNNPKKWGTLINGIEIRGIDYVRENPNIPVVITLQNYIYVVLCQLFDAGIKHYYTCFEMERQSVDKSILYQ